MRYTKLKSRYSWKPVAVSAGDILRLLERTVMAEVVVRRNGKHHWIGVFCGYDRLRRLFGGQVFYIDDQEFATLEEFKAHAKLDGRLFASFSEPLEVIDTQEGNPARYFASTLN